MINEVQACTDFHWQNVLHCKVHSIVSLLCSWTVAISFHSLHQEPTANSQKLHKIISWLSIPIDKHYIMTLIYSLQVLVQYETMHAITTEIAVWDSSLTVCTDGAGLVVIDYARQYSMTSSTIPFSDVSRDWKTNENIKNLSDTLT